MAHRQDGRTSAASNFLIRLSSVRTMGDERPDGYSSTCNFHISNERVRTVEVESAISFFDARASEPQLSDSGRSYLNCDSCLKETRVLTGYHIVQMVDRSSLSWNLERNQKLIEHWEVSGHVAETSGRMQAGTETSRYSMGSRRNEHFIWTDDAGRSSVRTG
jgi:hypothetical protein